MNIIARILRFFPFCFVNLKMKTGLLYCVYFLIDTIYVEGFFHSYINIYKNRLRKYRLFLILCSKFKKDVAYGRRYRKKVAVTTNRRKGLATEQMI